MYEFYLFFLNFSSDIDICAILEENANTFYPLILLRVYYKSQITFNPGYTCGSSKLCVRYFLFKSRIHIQNMTKKIPNLMV